MNELAQRLTAAVWATRDRLGDRWPMPEPHDSLRFATCEAAEVLDAWLRSIPEYRRNNPKAPDLRGEVADTAIMLITALNREPPADLIELDFDAQRLMDKLAGYCASALVEARRWKAHTNICLALSCCVGLVPDLDVAVTERLARIAEKHGGAAWV